jgi:exodeoxyribonuclease-3
MKLATWNVNSIKVRLPQLLAWLEAARPDALCLQELKTEEPGFPRAALEAAGYASAVFGQKTYNGVAILARAPLADVASGIPGFADEQSRVIAATVAGTRVVCLYCPNGQAVGSDKYDYKLHGHQGECDSRGRIGCGTISHGRCGGDGRRRCGVPVTCRPVKCGQAAT